jgi:hypothetical protein
LDVSNILHYFSPLLLFLLPSTLFLPFSPLFSPKKKDKFFLLIPLATSLEELIEKIDFYKRKILLHESVKEPEEAGDEWDPEVMDKNKKDAALAAAQKAAPGKAASKK